MDQRKSSSSLEEFSESDSPSRKKKQDKLDVIVRLLALLKEEEFTGWVKINFTQGSLGRVEKFEEVLKGK